MALSNDINDKKWSVLESDYVLNTPWITVRKDKIQQPQGTIVDDFYVLEYPNWITVIAITEDGHYVMERQYRHGIMATCYELCGGAVDDGEDPVETAKRELLEETGFSGGIWSYYMTSSPNPAAMTNVCHTYIAYGVKRVAEQKLENTEDIDVCLLTRDELLDVMNKGLISQGDMLAPLWRWMYENKN